MLAYPEHVSLDTTLLNMDLNYLLNVLNLYAAPLTLERLREANI